MPSLRIERFYRDLIIVTASLALALFLTHTGVIAAGLARVGGHAVLGSFAAGFFFTSVFTLAPAAVVLAGLAEHASALSVAFSGALGAMCGDMLLFLLVRDVFAEDLREFLKKHDLRLAVLPHLGFMRWLYPVVGAFIIASPLPDEFGLAMLGLTKERLAVMLPLTFVMNFLGILGLLFVAAHV